MARVGVQDQDTILRKRNPTGKDNSSDLEEEDLDDQEVELAQIEERCQQIKEIQKLKNMNPNAYKNADLPKLNIYPDLSHLPGKVENGPDDKTVIQESTDATHNASEMNRHRYHFSPTCYVCVIAIIVLCCVFVPQLANLNDYLFQPEFCDEMWTVHNVTGIDSSLKEHVFGQHLVIQTVSKIISTHATNPTPQKALVLSFNGWSGSGKSFVSNIIAEHLYCKGSDSKYVHKIISSHAFPTEEDVEAYKVQLKTWIVGNVSRCERSLFIIDEMPLELSDVLKPFLDYHDGVDGVDFRKSIFIFLSNTDSDAINDEMFSHWKNGRKREEVTIKQMDKLLNVATYNIEGGLWKSKLTDHHLIDFFVPFLPLEKKHVKMCIGAELKKQKKPIRKDIVDMIANELDYFPSKEQLFSTSGCKKVEKRVQVLA